MLRVWARLVRWWTGDDDPAFAVADPPPVQREDATERLRQRVEKRKKEMGRRHLLHADNAPKRRKSTRTRKPRGRTP